MPSEPMLPPGGARERGRESSRGWCMSRLGPATRSSPGMRPAAASRSSTPKGISGASSPWKGADHQSVDPAAVIAGGTILAGQHPHVFERVEVEIRDAEGRLLSSLGEHPGDERYIANEGTDRSMMFQPIFGANAVRTPWGDLVVHDLNNRYEIMAFAQDGSLARIVRRGHVPRFTDPRRDRGLHRGTRFLECRGGSGGGAKGLPVRRGRRAHARLHIGHCRQAEPPLGRGIRASGRGTAGLALDGLRP